MVSTPGAPEVYECVLRTGFFTFLVRAPGGGSCVATVVVSSPGESSVSLSAFCVLHFYGPGENTGGNLIFHAPGESTGRGLALPRSW